MKLQRLKTFASPNIYMESLMNEQSERQQKTPFTFIGADTNVGV